jgi:hypothetical protein
MSRGHGPSGLPAAHGTDQLIAEPRLHPHATSSQSQPTVAERVPLHEGRYLRRGTGPKAADRSWASRWDRPVVDPVGRTVLDRKSGSRHTLSAIWSKPKRGLAAKFRCGAIETVGPVRPGVSRRRRAS